MTPNSAYTLVPIVVGTNYAPAAQQTNFVDPNSGPSSPPGPLVDNGVTPPIYAMFCTVQGAGTVQIKAIGNSVAISIPAAAFKVGVVYYIYLGTLVADGGCTFVGYQYAHNPLIL